MPSSARYSALSKPTPGDPARPVLEMTFRGHRRDICCAAFQPASPSALPVAPTAQGGVPPRLLTAGADGAVMLWDARPTNRALRFVGHRGPVLGCDYCPLSVAGTSVTLLASCGLDGYARLWVPNLRRTASTYPSNYTVQQQQGKGPSGDGNGYAWRAHTGAARAIKFAQDGSHHIYTAGDDKSVKAWDLNYVASGSHYPSGEPLVTFHGSRFLGNFNWTTAAGPTTVTTASPKVFKNTNTHTNWVRALAVQQGGANFSHYIASGGDDNVVMVWDTRSPHTGPVHTFYEHRASVRGLSFHDNGYHVASCDASGVINLFDMRRSSSPSMQPQRARYGLLQHYTDAHGAGGIAVNDVCFAPAGADTNGSWLLSAGDDGTAKLWDTVEGFLYCTVQAHTGPVRTVSFTDDGAHFVTGGSDGVAMVWYCKLTAAPQQSTAAAAVTTTAAPTVTIQNYSYYADDEDRTGSEGAAQEQPISVSLPKGSSPQDAAEALPAPRPRPAARSKDHVDPSYAAWQRRHNFAPATTESTAKRTRKHKSDASRGEGGEHSPKPSSSSGRPPLCPLNAQPLPDNAADEVDAAPQDNADEPSRSHSPEEQNQAVTDRERSFARSEERYSHISTPRDEHEASERRRRQQEQSMVAAPQDAPPALPANTKHAGKHRHRKDAAEAATTEPQHPTRSERLLDLSDRRLENVENAVASLVEYVQEENAHRDRELARWQEEVDRRQGQQRAEMVALKGMMEQLIAQQTALIGRLGVSVHGAQDAPPPTTSTEAEPPAAASAETL